MSQSTPSDWGRGADASLRAAPGLLQALLALGWGGTRFPTSTGAQEALRVSATPGHPPSARPRRPHAVASLPSGFGKLTRTDVEGIAMQLRTRPSWAW